MILIRLGEDHLTKSKFIAHRRESDGEEHHLAEHLQGVSILAGEHASKIGLRRCGELIGLLHDLGKYSLAFQQYLKSAVGLIDPDADDYVDASTLKGKIDHSTAGSQYIWRQLSTRAGSVLGAGQLFATCIASHHSGLIDCLSVDQNIFGEDVFTRRMNKAQNRTYLDEVVCSADQEILGRANDLLNDEGLLKEVEILTQHICQANDYKPASSHHQLGLMVRFLFSCLIDGDRTNTADFEDNRVGALRQHGDYVDWSALRDRLEAHLQRLEPRYPIDSVRTEISAHCLAAGSREKGAYTLTVPTGGGKTLASLRFALEHARIRKLDRIIYVIPFTSIIDQNAEVVRNILETLPENKGKIVLEHHSNLTPEKQTWRQKILSETWDAPVVFTTMVQFLEALFGAGTRGARRMHQLANSVLIFDEAQALPIKCVHMFNNAVNFLVEQCNSTAVLCTATQPLLNDVAPDKGALRLSPNHRIVPESECQSFFEQLKRVDVQDRRKSAGWKNEEISQLALQEVENHGSCLVIVNTKASARAIYRLCADLSKEQRVHLSTDMCPAHRKKTLAAVHRRLKDALPILCVSTQLIEAGVDIDFAVVIRALAGIDSIAQAAGRCNRNGRSRKGIVYVVNLSDENLGKLPDIAKAREVANRVLDDFGDDKSRYGHNLFGPKAIEDYYRYYFFERRDEMTYPVTIGYKDTLLSLLSENVQARNAHGRKNKGIAPPAFSQSFMAAGNQFKSIDAPTQGIIVQFGKEGSTLVSELCAAYDVQRQYALLQRAQQFTVNVFPNVLKKLVEAEAVHPIQKDVGILYLDERYYSNEYGLTTESITGMAALDV